MKYYRIKEHKTFLDIVKQLNYKDKDTLEVKQLTNNSCNSVYELYSTLEPRWNYYYTIVDKDKILSTILLDYKNNIHYFVTNDLTINNTKIYIKLIKKLIKHTLKYRPVLFLTTSTLYSEAIKFNKLVGFKCYELDTINNISKWYVDKEVINGKYF